MEASFTEIIDCDLTQYIDYCASKTGAVFSSPEYCFVCDASSQR